MITVLEGSRMRFFDRISNRTALFFCLAGLVPLAALAGVILGRVSTILQRSAAETDQALVTSVQAAIDEYLGVFRDQCAAIALSPAVQSLDRVRQWNILTDFLRLDSLFFKVMVFDREGRMLDVLWKNRYRGEEKEIGSPAGDPRLAGALRRAVDTGQAVWAEPSLDSFSQPVLYLVTPIRSFMHEERVEASLVGAISLTGHKMQDLLDRTRLPPTAYACIVDDAGQILARKGAALPASIEKHTYPLEVDGRTVTYLPPPASTVSGRLRIEGRTMLTTASTLAGVGLTLIVGRPLDEVMAPANQAVRDVLLLSAIGLVLALVLSVVLSRSFVRPLLSLVEGIRKVGSGELSHRVPVERTDELGAAAGAFNEMAGELERQQLIEQLWAEEWTEDVPQDPTKREPGG